MKNRPPGASHPATREKSVRQLRICSNISTEMTRSKRSVIAKSFMSAVNTSTLESPRRSASPTM
jgi:hypothetical protein